MAEQEATQVEQQSQEEVVITIQDLDMATKIIGAFIERGAVKAVEAEDVGRVWKKMAAFVAQSNAAQQQADGSEVAEDNQAGE
jgi:hypothetical protein